jgi:O-antigen/teichoic acid export membrane protein
VSVGYRLSRVRGRGLRDIAGRVSWGLADQVVTSASNLLVSVLAARALSVQGFGAFAVAFTVYSFLIAGGRALISQPLAVRYAGAGPEAYRTAAQAATGATLLLGLTAGVVVAVVGLALGGILGTSLLCVGLLMPGLLLQDMWRLVFITEGRPRAAFVNDSVWGLTQLAIVSAFIALGRDNAATLLLAWGGSAVLVAVLGGLQFKGRPRVRASLPWIAAQRDLLKYYLTSFLTIMGAYQVTMLLIAGLGTPADVGALRAAQVVLGPLNLLGYALSAFAVPEIARRRPSGKRGIQVAVAISALLVLANVVWGVAVFLLPDSVGAALLGDTWTTARDVLPASLLGLVAIAAGFGANSVLVALGYAKETFRLNFVLAPSFVIFGLAGLEWGGAPGAALGLALAQVVVVPAKWWRVIVVMRRRQAERPDEHAVEDEGAHSLDRA